MKTKKQITVPMVTPTAPCDIAESPAIVLDTLVIEANDVTYPVEVVERSQAVTARGQIRVKAAASTTFGGSGVTAVATCAADDDTTARVLACTEAVASLKLKIEALEQKRLDRVDLKAMKNTANAYLVNVETVCAAINRAELGSDSVRLQRALKLENVDACTSISSGEYVFVWRKASKATLEKGLKGNEKLYAFSETQLICKREFIPEKGSVQAINLILRSMKGASLLSELLGIEGANAANMEAMEDFTA